MSFLMGEVQKQNQHKEVNGDHPLVDTTYSEHEKYSDYWTETILSEERNQAIHNHTELMFKSVVFSSLPVGELSL